MVSGCPKRDMNNCLEKFFAAGSRSYKSRVSFHGFRVSRRDVNNCSEKFVAAGSRSYKS
jgi:hypothetical protein